MSNTALATEIERPLTRADLVRLVHQWAPAVGNHAGSGQAHDTRWWCRLELNDSYEVWLIAWDSDQSTTFHDHGPSSGAVKVISGSLIERRLQRDTAMISEREIETGKVFAFGPDAVHDMHNADRGPSLSVHVYSPPLSTMTYFDVDNGIVTARDAVQVDGPEPLL
jgi:hypothetical protein